MIQNESGGLFRTPTIRLIICKFNVGNGFLHRSHIFKNNRPFYEVFSITKPIHESFSQIISCNAFPKATW